MHFSASISNVNNEWLSTDFSAPVYPVIYLKSSISISGLLLFDVE